MTDAAAERLRRSLLAEDTATAHRPAGPCAICGHQIIYAQRYAKIVPDGTLAHLACIAAAAAARRGRVPVIR